jgi:D-alanyl-D-alanine carboxypeptidase/D-alanyl-D-alanine-endopeptidase (penicillin-binding protein 4)
VLLAPRVTGGRPGAPPLGGTIRGADGSRTPPTRGNVGGMHPLCAIARAAALCAAAALPLLAQPAPPARIRAVMDRPAFAHAHWGLEVRDVATGRVLMAHQPDQLFVPGSTTKVVTMATALHRLGPDHRFRTRVVRTGPIVGGVVQGDLVLVAAGDPNLSGRLTADGRLAFVDQDHSYGGPPLATDPLAVLRTLAQQVRARGITGLTGQVLVDASLFAEGERELGTRVVLSPFVLNDNVVDLVVTPAATVGAPATLTVSPATAYVSVQPRLVTVDSTVPPAIRIDEDSSSRDRRVLVVTGQVPRGAPRNPRWAVPDPSRFGEIAFAEVLTAAGVPALPRLGARPRAAATRLDDSLVVAEHVSLPLIEAARVLLKTSQNLHASNLPLLLGALERAGSGRTGFDVAREFLQGEGLPLDGAVQGDGAGGNAFFSPRFMTQLLVRLRQRPWGDAFAAALPVLGRDGTLARVQVGAPGAGHVFAKTGTFGSYDPLNRRTLTQGKGLAGYVVTRSGRVLAIALYVNHVAVAQGDPAQVAGEALGEIASLVWELSR